MSKPTEYRCKYTNQQGLLFEKIIRVEQTLSKPAGLPNQTKTVYWAWPNSDKWVRSASKLPCDLIPYKFIEVSKAQSILLLSDEDDVDGLNQYDSIKRNYAPTCLPDNRWIDDYALGELRGKDIVIIPRQEDPTAYYLASRLYDVCLSIKVLQLNYINCLAKNPGVNEWVAEMGNTESLVKLIDGTPAIDKDNKGILLDSNHVGITKMLENPADYEREQVISRISALHSKDLRERVMKGIAKDLGISPEDLQSEIEAVSESEDKIKKQEEASELRLKGLIDVAVSEKGQKVFLIQNGTELKSMPHMDGKNENGEQVRFLPPQKINFLLPKAEDVLKHYQSEDPSLFQDLMNLSRDYVHLKEIDRTIMITSVFLSYVIHHPDIHYLPIVQMVSDGNHGKSHVLKFIANTGYRGKWLRSFNLASCVRYNDEFQSVTCLDIYDFNKSVEMSQGHMDFVLGKIEKGATIPKVNRPSAERYQQSDEYDPYGLLIVGSNTSVSAKHGPLLTRILPLQNILSNNKAAIKQPDNPLDFLEYRNRLTAWKARIMTRRLPDRGYIEMSGRLYDMGKPFLQILNTVYPQGYESMVQYLRDVEQSRAIDKSSSTEAEILKVINGLFKQAVRETINEGKSRPKEVWISQHRLIDTVLIILGEGTKVTNRIIPKICRDKLNLLEVRKKENDYLIRIEESHLEILLKTYGVEESLSKSDYSEEIKNAA